MLLPRFLTNYNLICSTSVDCRVDEWNFVIICFDYLISEFMAYEMLQYGGSVFEFQIACMYYKIWSLNYKKLKIVRNLKKTQTTSKSKYLTWICDFMIGGTKC